MTEILRSEEMSLVQIFIQSEAGHDVVEELGHDGLIQFKDMTPDVNAFQRRFVNEVKRYDEMDRNLRFFSDQVAKVGLEEGDPTAVKFGESDPNAMTMDNMEARFKELDKEIKEINKNQAQLVHRYNELIELKWVLEKASDFFQEAKTAEDTIASVQSQPQESEPEGGIELLDTGHHSVEAPLLGDVEQGQGTTHGYAQSITLGFVSGVIERPKVNTFERVLWRATRGNLFMRQMEIDAKIKDPDTDERIEKNVFIVYYQGERVRDKITKICDGFGSNMYQCPEGTQERAAMLVEVEQQLSDLKAVIETTLRHRRQMLSDVASNLTAWTETVHREKAIYHTMNLFNFDVTNKVFLAEGWAPTSAVETIQRTHLRRATEKSGALAPSILRVIETKETPPTYHKLNKVTKGFQALVDSYGVCRYREVNPATFMISTFPFLYAVMFGDLGHGFIIALYALYMVLKEKKVEKSMMAGDMTRLFFLGRYIMLGMGILAMYCGILYNETFSIPMDLFGTNFEYHKGAELMYGEPKSTDRCYPFGADPGWNGADNELTYYNSLKMKMSILMGVVQMMLGIYIHFMNARQYKKPLDIWCEFVPQVIFLGAIFGYLCVCICVKWLTFYENTNLAPSLMNLLIQMVMAPGKVNPKAELYSGQATVQLILVLMALVAVPWMMAVKPIIQLQRHKKAMREASNPEDIEKFEFGEIVIHQLIHSIEFLIGCISNTASYLRLWALSLAHSELSKVFYEKVLLMTIEMNNVLVIFVGFAVWAGATFAVLCVMESLSAFLHALRLHWVEFQNKFYLGDGYKFMPLTFTPE